MARFDIPNNLGQVRQVNRGDIFGELWGTFNIDLTSSPGKIKVSKALRPIFNPSGINKNIETMVVYNGRIGVFGNDATNPNSGDMLMRLSLTRNPRITGNWSRSFSTSFNVTEFTDSTVFAGLALVSNATNIDAYDDITTTPSDADWWTSVAGGTALTSGKPHVIDVSKIGNETLFITDGNLVRYMNITAGPTYNKSTVTLAEQLTACCLATDYVATWVGTYSSDGNAYVYEIYIGETDEFGTPVARNAYKVDGTAVLSMDVVDGVVYIVTDRGHIQVFNGRAFVTVASFPFAFDSVTIKGCSIANVANENTGRAIHPKGMRADGKVLKINITTDNQLITDLAANPIDDDDIFNNVVVNERSPSGIWEYDTETGTLNHRHAFSLTGMVGAHNLSASGPLIVLDNQYTRVIAGARVNDNAYVFVEDPDVVPTGYFITPEIDTNSVQEAWKFLALKTESLADGESITVKYRTSKNRGYPAYAEGTWLNSTTFNTTDDLSMVEEGDEIEIIDGTNAGKMAQVLEINPSGSVYSIVLDTAVGTTGDTDYARFQNWKVLDLEDNGQFQKGGTDDATTWVQFKVVMTGDIEMRGFTNSGTVKNEVK